MTPVPILFEAASQRARVQRLFDHCYKLDGTTLTVLSLPEPDISYPNICNWAFMQACKRAARDKTDFIWVEADSIPVKAGWVESLATEWRVAQSYGKEILWTTDTYPPHDWCTGIGVYRHDFLRHVDLQAMKGQGFDGWIMKNLPHLIHRTPLIQHSYGVYDNEGRATLHRNPVVRSDAVIFHKDQYQTLITL